jgi:hypothetical protein
MEQDAAQRPVSVVISAGDAVIAAAVTLVHPEAAAPGLPPSTPTSAAEERLLAAMELAGAARPRPAASRRAATSAPGCQACHASR